MVYLEHGVLFSHKKEWNPAIGDNMDGPWGRYAKWEKSDQVYMWKKKKKPHKNLIEKDLIFGYQRSEVGRGRIWWSPKVPTCRYRKNKYWECYTQHDE